ncbi:MAG: hypothetical protein D6796_14245 [Caldilineae bacterium]|nr:MAG: hypothetical protein D6796_14245 [Caldilineae bacterium]
MKRRLLLAVAALLAAGLLWLLTTNNDAVWPVRNTLHYRLAKAWWGWAGFPQGGEGGTLAGVVRDEGGRPIAGAWVLVSRWDGETYRARTAAGGRYRIEGVPAGRYVPVAGAPGYANRALGGAWRRTRIRPGAETRLDVTLATETPPVVAPGSDLRLSERAVVTCTAPVESRAVRQTVTFDNAGQPNQPTLYYTPVTATLAAPLPVLLTIYPGPADSWECASAPLAAAGYAVIAAGPAYSLNLERDIDELERLRQFAAGGEFPGANPERLALLGGSYSALLVERMLERNPTGASAAVLLGPPTDLFEMRHQLELGNFTPPFGLDRVLVALGLPDRQPMRYWQYSAAYHLPPDLPPLLLIHSRSDEVVPFAQSQLLADNLEAAGLPYELHFFEGASHYLLSESGEGVAIYHLTLDFLDRHLRLNASLSAPPRGENLSLWGSHSRRCNEILRSLRSLRMTSSTSQTPPSPPCGGKGTGGKGGKHSDWDKKL